MNREYDGHAAYHEIWAAAVAGRFPTSRLGRRWMVDPADLPRVAEALGLTHIRAA